MAAGALALAAMLLNIVAPKAAHAIVATAVQVMNTSATPVPTLDTGAPGRHPFALYCEGSTSCTTSLVPAGTTFVNDSIWYQTGPGSSYLQSSVGGVPIHAIFPDLVTTGTYAANITIYADAGTAIRFVGPYGSDVIVLFVGHLVPTT
jgi:hypothetical protein